ncbi:MAG: PqqD family protein [Chloroflexi bacterium]|nr:PqqD family protein [Chloroflexota bacterium]
MSVTPLRRSDVIGQHAGRETLLYDPVADAVHTLNPTAWAVWELCDGRHTPADMATHLRAAFADVSDQDVDADVLAILAVFAREELIHRYDLAKELGYGPD